MAAKLFLYYYYYMYNITKSDFFVFVFGIHSSTVYCLAVTL